MNMLLLRASGSALLIGLECLALVGCQSTNTERLLSAPIAFPEAIRTVQPEPGSVVYGDDHTVCVEVQSYPLLEPGDALRRVDDVELTLDNREVEQSPAHIVFDTLAALYDENDQLIAKAPAIDRVCWIDLALSDGIHVAKIAVRSSSGRISYNYKWAFEVR